MTESSLQSRQAICNFEQKVINRSAADLLCLDGLADYLLNCCSAEAKANTLSLCSFLPLLLTSVLISGPNRLWFLISFISILLHQILDIANKKQAYRLQSFSFGTYYFDHTCDSFSCLLIIYILGRLFQVHNNWLWFSLFVFGILPFYTHHLTMYYNEYMCFHLISPATQGLLILEFLCLIGFISPSLYSTVIIGQSFTISAFIIVLASLWLIIFMAIDLRQIIKRDHKENQTCSLNNLFVIFVLGYVMFETAVIEPEIINNSNVTFGFLMYSVTLCFSLIIGELILKYGVNEKFQQISGFTLAFTTFLSISYALFAVIGLGSASQAKIGMGASISLAICSTVYYFYRSNQIKNYVNNALNS